MGTTPTFVNHIGNGVSLIDYMFSTVNGILKSTKVEEKHYLNQSAHTVVSSILNVTIEASVNKGKQKRQSKTIIAVQIFFLYYDYCRVEPSG